MHILHVFLRIASIDLHVFLRINQCRYAYLHVFLRVYRQKLPKMDPRDRPKHVFLRINLHACADLHVFLRANRPTLPIIDPKMDPKIDPNRQKHEVFTCKKPRKTRTILILSILYVFLRVKLDFEPLHLPSKV